MSVHEPERLRRLLLRLGDEVTARMTDTDDPGRRAERPTIVLLIDGYVELRAHLADVETDVERDALERIVTHGAACAVDAVLAVGQPSAVPPTVLARCPRRWIHHLVDRHEALAWGFQATDVPPAVAGRVAISAGLHAQLLRPVSPRAHLAVAGREPPPTGPRPIEVLAAHVAATSIGRGRDDGRGGLLLPIGLAFDTGEAIDLEVPDGEHVLVLGPARSGRSTALWRIVEAWRTARPAGWAAVLAPRPRAGGPPPTHRDLDHLFDDLPTTGPVLVAVDDAELVDGDADGGRHGGRGDRGRPSGLGALVAARRSGLLVVAAGKPDALRQAYGHWTTVVRRSRLGVVLSAGSELDGDLLGATLPRRRPIAARPGLAWLVCNGEVHLAQIARDAP